MESTGRDGLLALLTSLHGAGVTLPIPSRSFGLQVRVHLGYTNENERKC